MALRERKHSRQGMPLMGAEEFESLMGLLGRLDHGQLLRVQCKVSTRLERAQKAGGEAEVSKGAWEAGGTIPPGVIEEPEVEITDDIDSLLV